MLIREATKADSKWILHHRVEMFRSLGESEDFISETERLTKDFLKEEWWKEYRYFLVEENDMVVGGCGLSNFRIPPFAHQKTGIYSYLSNMYVEPEYRGKGIGRALVRQVISICKNEGIGLILLHASNLGGALYESEGFESPNWLMQFLISRHLSSQ